MAIMDTLFSYWETIKGYWQGFDFKQWSENMAGSSAEALQAAVFFGGAFAVGFLFKKYFKFLLGSLVLTIIVIKILEHHLLITIDWPGVNALAGLEPDADLTTISAILFTWIKENIILFVASSVGFLIGYKIS
ncbi:FUN14 domain-containing protein [Candidatus Babeliales bacterium]|nr:FUN14 domain-containing protein [Candidatus Babeliales bacterium]